MGTTIFPDSGKALAASLGVDPATSESIEDTGNTNGFVRIDNTIENPDPRFGEPETRTLQDFSVQEVEIVGEIIESRDQSKKEFLLDDQTRLVVVYPEAVHYEKDGEWKEIDNALRTDRKADGTIVLKNTDSILDVELPQTLTSEDEIALTYDGYRIAFRLEGAVTPLEREEIDLPVVPVEPITPITPVVSGEEVQQSSSEVETEEVALSESAATSSLENVVSLESEKEKQDSVSEIPADAESVSEAERQENAQLGMESIADETTTATENASEVEVQESSATESSVPEMASTADEPETELEIKVETLVQPETQIQPEETILTAGMMIAEDIMVIDGPEEELLQMRLPAAAIGTVDNEVLSAGEKATMTAREQQIHSAFADSKVKYSTVLPQTDIIYNLTSTSLKESIVMKSCPEDIPEYRYFISCDGLSLELNEDNSISAKTEDDEEIFILPAPFIMDSGEDYTYEVEVTLEETDGGYRLTYHLPDTWIRSSDRVWPLVLDPVVETAQIRQTIQDKYVASGATTDHNDANLSVGYHATKGIERIYLQFRTTDGTSSLPALTAADVILDARLYLARTNTSTPSKQVNVHRVTSAWDSETLQWSNKPGYDSNIADYDLVTGNNWYSWEITDIARSWYADGNNGLILKMNSADENVTSANNKLFCSSDSSSDYRPILTMLYRNSSGLEGFWDYDSYDLGRGGVGDINLFTGNLVWTHHGLSYDGNLMPVAVNLIYNANDRNGNAAEHDYGFGYGWRTPYHQEVGEYTPPDNAEVSGNYYFWDDEDGTRHYFKETSTAGTYEDEFGAELTLKVASDGSVTIKDKDGNISCFDTEGRLIKIENNQKTKSTINITYTTTTGHLISKITDGAGRVYQFAYSSGKVSTVSYKGKANDALKSISYTYTSGDLTKITYPDSKYVTFSYNSHLLTGVEDIAYGAGAMKAAISYNQTGVGVPNRVSRVVSSDKDSSGTKQRQIDYVYCAGYTTIKDQMGNELQYQFNKYGNTVCIKDADGNAVFAEYATDISDSGTPNQLKVSSKLQTTVRNYLYNASFEESAYWVAGADLGATGSHGYSSGESYLGEDSYRLTMDTTTGCVQVGEPDWVTVTSGKMYTFSAYLKTDFVTENGTGVRLVADTPSTSYFSDAIKVDSDWQRLDLTITVPSGVSQMKFWVRLESKGTIYADCIQLVEGPLPSRFNLVENGDFTYSGSGSSGAYGWLEGSGCGTSDVRVDADGKAGAPGMDDLCYTMTGSVSNMKRCYQDIDISGSAGDTYSVGGWARGDVAAVTDDTRVFGIVARFYNTDGTESEMRIDFNPDLNGSATWQYASGKLVAENDYSYIRILLVFEKEVNQVWFDGITLTKDEFGNSYTYDVDGNITSVADIQKQESDYEYKDGTNDLISSSLPGGRNMTYTYDNYHNVISAVSGRNQKSNFAYDAYGRNTSVSIPDATGTYPLIIEANATYNGSYVSSITDTNRNTVNYGYDLNYGELDWVQGPMDGDDERTTYTYDTMHRLTGTTKPVAGLSGNLSSVSASYTYEGDNIKTITHSNDSDGGTTYTLNYGLFDALTSVKVGTRTLITNTYDYSNQNFNLSAQTYGNGDTVSYTYDKTGRLLAELHDGADKVTYDYDAEGNLGKMSDFANTLYFKYYYDLSGRLSKVKEAGSMPRWQYYSYDIANNLSKYEEEIGGVTYGTSYTYDTDNRHTITEAGANGAATSKRVINYEQYYGRTNYMASVHNGNEILKSQFYQYKRQGNDTHASYQLQTWNIILPSGTQSVGYTYDENGNMLSVGYGMNTAANKYDGGSISYSYDGLQQLVREENEKADAIWVYIYDAGGNIVKKETYAYTTRKLTEEIDYYYTDDGQWGDLLTEWNGKTFTYDSIGNLTSDGSWSYTWEHGRQLVGMSKSGTSISYTYAPDGMRRTKTVGSTAYKYYYDGNLLTHMTKGSQYIHIYYDANGNPVSMYYSPDGGTYYYLQNPQGDVIGLLDSSGNLVVEYYYDAWGKSVGIAGSKASTVGAMNPLRYRGYIYDTETGLFYVSSRYYNPEVGRFINADVPSVAWATPMNLYNKNLFAYCDNNPVMRIDVDGYLWDTIFDLWALGESLQDVIESPDSRSAWISLGADFIFTLVPGIPNSNATAKVASKVDDVYDATVKTSKTINYTKKVTNQINNVNDLNHSFPRLIDFMLNGSDLTIITGGDGKQRILAQMPGSINGIEGVFEYIFELDGTCNHRFFRRTK